MWLRALVLVVALAGCQGLEKAEQGITGKASQDDLDPAIVLVHATNNEVNWICTGTLITQEAILTAAHCVRGGKRWSIEFVAFGNRLEAGVARVEVHPDWNSNAPDGNDLAILWMDNLIQDVPPIPIFMAGTPVDSLRMVGFGVANAETGDGTGVKRSAVADSVLEYGRLYGVRGDQLPCFGDSGGPALVTVDGVEMLAGVLSFGSNSTCTQESYYTKLSAYPDFINPIIGLPPPPPGGCSFCGFGIHSHGGEGWAAVCCLLIFAWFLTRRRPS